MNFWLNICFAAANFYFYGVTGWWVNLVIGIWCAWAAYTTYSYENFIAKAMGKKDGKE